jgi:hypothetical protein
MALNLPLLYVLWSEEHCQTSPNLKQITKPLTRNKHLSLLYFCLYTCKMLWLTHRVLSWLKNFKVRKVCEFTRRRSNQSPQLSKYIFLFLYKETSSHFYIKYTHKENSEKVDHVHVFISYVAQFPLRGRSQTMLPIFWLFLTTYPPALTFSMVWKLTKSGHFWTTYLPTLSCKRNLWMTI